ncbi:MAG: hypothetical protein FJZ01_17215 [Candidatus Sericytochromatia bacterium]|nr:hypothetical protein [Candidatus Tanganyikabacteria bacterium]
MSRAAAVVLILLAAGSIQVLPAAAAPPAGCSEVGAPTVVSSRAGKTTVERQNSATRDVSEVLPADELVARFKRRVKLGVARERKDGLLRTIERWRDETVVRRTPRQRQRTVRVATWQERPVKEQLRVYRHRYECAGREPPELTVDDPEVIEVEPGPWVGQEVRETVRDAIVELRATEEIEEAIAGSRVVGSSREVSAPETSGGVWTGLYGLQADRSKGGKVARNSSTAKAIQIANIEGAKSSGSKFKADQPLLLEYARGGLDLTDIENGAVWRVTSDGLTLTWGLRLQGGASRLIQAKVAGVGLEGDTLTVTGIFSAQVPKGTVQSRVLRGRVAR